MKTKSTLNKYERFGVSRQRAAWRGVGLIILVLILVVFWGGIIFRPVEYLALGLSHLFSWRVENNARLWEERASELAGRLATFDLLKTENERLRVELDLKRVQPDLITAEVWPSLMTAPYGLLRAQVGAGVQIRSGAEVRFQNFWLGRVVSQTGETIKIQLLSAAGVETPVLVGMNDIPALGRGLGGGNFSVTLPRNVELALGDLAHGQAGADSLAVAVVGAIDSDPAESLQTVYLNFPLNLMSLHYVQIAR